MPAKRGACLPTLSIKRRMSSELPARMAEAGRSALSELCAVRHLDDAVSAFLEACGPAPLRRSGGSAVPASANNSQISPLPRGLRHQSRRGGQLRTARENHRMLRDFRRRAIGDADGAG